jgi:hypothetical protein
VPKPVAIHATPAERVKAKAGADDNKEEKPVGPAVTCVPLYGVRARIVHSNPPPMV